MLEALRAPFELDPITIQVDASISIALCPSHCEHPNDLLNCVETTMPHTKEAASKIVIYDAGRVRSAPAVRSAPSRGVRAAAERAA